MAWYSKGVSFSCKRCGHCCSGEPGYVYLSEDNIEKISKYLALEKEEFLEKYTREVDMGTYQQISLKENEDFSCVFLTDAGCTIYPVRPLQCDTYPFWEHVFIDRALYEAEKGQCPGLGCGTFHSESEIREKIRATRLEKLATRVK